MLGYVITKTIHLLITLFFALALVFVAIRLAPGDPVTDMLSRGTGFADTRRIEEIKQLHGLNDPIPVQFGNFLFGMATRGDLGRSWANNQPVIDNIRTAWPYTFGLAIVATLISVMIGIPLGVASAAKRGSLFDFLTSFTALSGVSAPVFFTALFFLYVFAFRFGLFPVSGADSPQSVVLPALSLGLISAAGVARFARTSMIEVMSEDYVRTARAKGLKGSVVLYRHALRNALIPIITIVGIQFGLAMCGAVITETVFSWPGLGQLMITSIQMRDYDMVQGAAMVFAASVAAVNLLIDIAYSYVDPRIKV